MGPETRTQVTWADSLSGVQRDARLAVAGGLPALSVSAGVTKMRCLSGVLPAIPEGSLPVNIVSTQGSRTEGWREGEEEGNKHKQTTQSVSNPYIMHSSTCMHSLPAAEGFCTCKCACPVESIYQYHLSIHNQYRWFLLVTQNVTEQERCDWP